MASGVREQRRAIEAWLDWRKHLHAASRLAQSPQRADPLRTMFSMWWTTRQFPRLTSASPAQIAEAFEYIRLIDADQRPF